MKKFFWFCSGASVNILEKCPETEHHKFVGIGATVFFTALLASISGGYALYTVFDAIVPAIVFGIIWGLCIFNLDRYIVSTIKKEGNFFRELLQALPRIFLALVIAVVISKPLELRIFAKEIRQKLDQKQADLAIAQYKLADKKFYEIDSLKNEIVKLKAEIDLKAGYRDTLYEKIISEAEGRSVTNKVGKGPVYKEKREQFDKSAQELLELKAKNEQQISAIQQKVNLLDSIKLQEKINQDKNIANYDGLMAQINALQQLPPMASWFILLLFICIETAPIITKLLSPRGAYDDYLKEIETEISAVQMEKSFSKSLEMSQKLKVNEYLSSIDLTTNLKENTHLQDKIKDAHQTMANEAIEKWKTPS